MCLFFRESGLGLISPCSGFRGRRVKVWDCKFGLSSRCTAKGSRQPPLDLCHLTEPESRTIRRALGFRVYRV